jgi:type IV secretory pathway VirD2 relaxase
MAKPVSLPGSGRLTELDFVSYGRRGRHTPLQFNRAQLDQIGRTVRGVPEVMVKVSGGGKSAAAVTAHLSYIDRHGKLEVHTDEGEIVQGRAVAQQLSDTWNLEAGRGQYRPELKSGTLDRRPKQVHNIVFSMPKGTPPEKLLLATQKFAREKFALKHRYAMVLHTDQGHPHVHLVVKAVSEQGERLYIRKVTLRAWREDFAQYLRELGVAANATPTQLRGRPKERLRDGIYRALKRGESTFMRTKAESVAKELMRGGVITEPGKAKLLATREQVVQDLIATAANLRDQGEPRLAREVEAFLRRMPGVVTGKEHIAKALLANVAAQRSRTLSAGRERSMEDRAR